MPSANPNMSAQQPGPQPQQPSPPQPQSQPSAPQSPKPQQAPPQGSNQVMTDYKQRMSQLKAQSADSVNKFKESVNKGIDEGKADPIFEAVYKFLSDVLCAPYDILSYMLINIVNLPHKDKHTFANTGTVIALVLAGIYVVEFLLTKQFESLMSVLACVASMILVRSFKGFDIQASINLDELLDEDDLYL